MPPGRRARRGRSVAADVRRDPAPESGMVLHRVAVAAVADVLGWASHCHRRDLILGVVGKASTGGRVTGRLAGAEIENLLPVGLRIDRNPVAGLRGAGARGRVEYLASTRDQVIGAQRI